MNKSVLIVSCLMLSFSYYVDARLKTSLIIPCHIKHVRHLYDLLQICTQQTLLPDEIVISVSESKKIDSKIVSSINDTKWPFKVTLLLSEHAQKPGQNRNIACNNATGDVFICQDADDIPHPQRIEVITYCFEQYRCDHFSHTFVIELKEKALENFFKKLVPQELNYVHPHSYEVAWNMSITNGNVSISKKVFSQVQWPAMRNGEDVAFNREVYARFGNRIALNVPLLIYRNHLSSYRRGSENLYDQYKAMLELNGFEVRNY